MSPIALACVLVIGVVVAAIISVLNGSDPFVVFAFSLFGVMLIAIGVMADPHQAGNR